MPSLIFVADPMCAWCYAVGPELDTLRSGVPELQLDIMAGGLRAYRREPVDEEIRNLFIPQWQRAREASGLALDDAILSRDGFVFDTEPACRAVVTARSIAPEAAPAVFGAIQHAFFVDGKDVTQAEIMGEIAADALKAIGIEMDAAGFLQRWASGEMVEQTMADFQQTRNWKIDGFPTVVLARGSRLDLVTSGFMRTAEIVERIQAIVDSPDSAA